MKQNKNQPIFKIALSLVAVFMVAFLFLFIQSSEASISKSVNYQGLLADSAGDAVADGSYTLHLKIYTLAGGGSSVWSADPVVTTTDGVFSTMMNLSTLDFDGSSFYLGVAINSDPEMTPRKQIGSVPQAINANNLIGDGLINITGGASVGGALNVTGNTTLSGTLKVNNKILASEFDCTVDDTAGGGDYTTINSAWSAGCRKMYIKNGSYTITASLTSTSPTPIWIVGESREGVVIDYSGLSRLFWLTDSTNPSPTVTGESVYFTYGSRVVTSNGTPDTQFITWGIEAGDMWCPSISANDGHPPDICYEIKSVDSETQITLSRPWEQADGASGTYFYFYGSYKNFRLENTTFVADAGREILQMYNVGLADASVVFKGIVKNVDTGSGKLTYDYGSIIEGNVSQFYSLEETYGSASIFDSDFVSIDNDGGQPANYQSSSVFGSRLFNPVHESLLVGNRLTGSLSGWNFASANYALPVIGNYASNGEPLVETLYDSLNLPGALYVDGAIALQQDTTLYSIFLGQDAGYSNTTGSNNFFGGYQAGYSNVDGNQNVFLGRRTGYAFTSGATNNFIGSNSGESVVSGDGNNFFGSDVTWNMVEGNNNSFFGQQVAGRMYYGNENTLIGAWAGDSIDYGLGLTGVGYYSLGNFSPENGSISAFADAGGGEVTVTSVGHTLVGGELVTIIGTTNYNAEYTVVSVNGNDFNITAAWVSNDATGNWFRTDRGFNTALGYEAGIGSNQGDNVGSYNNFIGRQSGYSMTSGSYNDFIGYQAGYNNTTGSNNFFGGYQAGYSNTTGRQNFFGGYQAGYLNTTGIRNVFLGYEAGDENTTGSSNVFVGFRAGEGNVAGQRNVAIGQYAMYDNKYGDYNTVLGIEAGGGSGGSNSVILGDYAGGGSFGSRLFFLGSRSGYNNTYGQGDTGVGYQSLYLLQPDAVATGNIDGGFSDGGGVTIATTTAPHGLADQQEIFIDGTSYRGVWIITYIDDYTFSIPIAFIAGTETENPWWHILTTTANTALGYQAGYSNITGSYNFFGGYQAGYNFTTAANNVMLGYQAGYGSSTDPSTGGNNVFIGRQSGYSNTTGNSNNFIGNSSGYSNTTGTQNNFLGEDAGSSNTVGSYNTFLGHYTGYGNTSGDENTYVGYDVAEQNNGSRNTYLGLGAGSGVAGSGSDNVFLGYYAGYNEAGSNKLYIENSSWNSPSNSSPLIYGEFDSDFLRVNGDLEVVGDIYSAGTQWTAQSAAEANQWQSVAYGNGMFVAVSSTGTNRVMTSPDGVNWTAQSVTEDSYWTSVTYGNGLFVAVAALGTNRVMTSPDGVNWTLRNAADASTWLSVAYGNGTFVAVANADTNRVMTSPDGVNWTVQSAAEANGWISVVYGNGLFVAVATYGTNQVMTSPDGVNWTAQSEAEANQWLSVTYGNGLFVAVANTGTNRVMTSPDGANWTAQSATEASGWQCVAYGNGLFVAGSADGDDRIMTSPDGVNWTARNVNYEQWKSIAYGNGIFVAVSTHGPNYVMTSGKPEQNVLAHNNTYQGGMNIFGDVTVGGNILPNADDTYDLGSSSNRWRDLYLGPASLHIGTDGNESVISYNTTTNQLEMEGLNLGQLNTSSLLVSSGNLLTGTVGFGNYLNLSGGLGTGDELRLTSTGNLQNIGSIQAGEMNLTRGGTFASAVDYYSIGGPNAMGDLNGDGKADLAVANFGGTVSVFINDGDGTFASLVSYGAGSMPYSVAVDDLNGDGKADLVVANLGSNNVSVLLNDGDGTFDTPDVTYDIGAAPSFVTAGDLNGDGKADLVVTISNNVSVLINNGDGTFASAVSYGVGPNPTYIDIGDLNGDGKADLVVTNGSFGGNSASVLINDGDGTFDTPDVLYGTGVDPYSVSIGDLNGDGKADFAVANHQSSNIVVFINNGDGTFALGVSYGAGTGQHTISVGDLNGDGKADLAVSNQTSNNISVLINNGDGTFAAKVDYGGLTAPTSLSMGDLNGDGKVDLAVSNSSNVSILLNQPQTMFFADASTGYIGIGNDAPSSLLDLQLSGTVKADNTLLEITNSTNAVDMDGTLSSILFNQYYYDATTPAVADSGLISLGTETDWTSTASTQDSFLSFSTALDGTLGEKMRITSEGNVGIGATSPQARLDVGTGKITGGTRSASYRNYLDIAGDVGFPAFDFIFQGGNSNTGNMRVGMVDVFGTNDIFFQSAPLTTAGYTFYENVNGAGAIISTTGNGGGATTSPIIFSPSRTEKMRITSTGNVGIGDSTPDTALKVVGALCVKSDANDCAGNAAGTIYATNTTVTGADYAEYFETTDTDLVSGEAVCIDPIKENAVKRCTRSADNNLMGIISSNPSIVGNSADNRENDKNYKIVAMLGQIKGNVSSENGNINIGDNLTSSSIPGYLRKANAEESTVGIALQGFSQDKGSIQILISRRNKSLTVEKVEEAVSKRIADMNVEDQVNVLIAQAKNELDKASEARFTNMESLMATLQEQLAELKNQTALDSQLALLTSQTDLNTQDSTFIKLLLGTDRVENVEDVDILGKLSAKTLSTGGIEIVVLDTKAPTIGTATILPADDTNDGMSVVVKTKAVVKNSRIFIDFENNPNAFSWTEKIEEGGDAQLYSGFKILLSNPTEDEIMVDWWIVNQE